MSWARDWGAGRQAGPSPQNPAGNSKDDFVLGVIEKRRRKSSVCFRSSPAEIRQRKAWTRGGEEKTIASQKAGADEPLNSGSGQRTERRRWIIKIIEMMFTKPGGLLDTGKSQE